MFANLTNSYCRQNNDANQTHFFLRKRGGVQCRLDNQTRFIVSVIVVKSDMVFWSTAMLY